MNELKEKISEINKLRNTYELLLNQEIEAQDFVMCANYRATIYGIDLCLKVLNKIV